MQETQEMALDSLEVRCYVPHIAPDFFYKNLLTKGYYQYIIITVLINIIKIDPNERNDKNVKVERNGGNVSTD